MYSFLLGQVAGSLPGGKGKMLRYTCFNSIKQVSI